MTPRPPRSTLFPYTTLFRSLIAAGEAWALASEAIAAPYRTGSQAIVYRPFVEPPIPCWLALVWLPEASAAVQRLVEVARRSGLAVGDADGTTKTAGSGEALGPPLRSDPYHPCNSGASP